MLPLRTFAVVALIGAAAFPGSPIGQASTVAQWAVLIGLAFAMAGALGCDLAAHDRRIEGRQRIARRL